MPHLSCGCYWLTESFESGTVDVAWCAHVNFGICNGLVKVANYSIVSLKNLVPHCTPCVYLVWVEPHVLVHVVE